MKTISSIVLRTIEGCVLQVRSQPLFSGGVALSQTNREIFSRMFEAWLFLTEDLMLRLQLNEESRRARLENFTRALLSCDLNVLLSFVEGVYAQLISEHATLDRFKGFLDVAPLAPAVSGGLLSPINGAVFPFLSETDDKRKAHLLSSIGQFLRFPRKLELQDIGLEAKATEDYEETERELEAMSYEDDDEIVESIHRILVSWLRDFHIENLLPAHGPGSVAEGSLALADKFKACRTDPLIEVGLANSGARRAQEFFPLPLEPGLVRRSRTVFVPKTATKLRTISMEPATLQYLQQGVMWSLYRYIDAHPYLGVRIRLSDQTQNQILAWEGSWRYNYSTIDLSHASDSVAWALVRRVFRHTPLLKWCLLTRSRETLLPDGRVLQLRKFAPMGSALCFPIECLLFAAVTEYAVRRTATCRVDASQLYSVYGDDIVLPTRAYDMACAVLRALGFTVNMSKSYHSGVYRESCGKEYYAGIDITPLYYRIPFYRKRITPSAYGSLCSLANNAKDHCLPVLRSFIIDRALNAMRMKPYFTSNRDESPHIYSPAPTNFHVQSRWSSRYQREEGRFISVRSKRRGLEHADDDLSYFCKLVELARRPQGPRTELDVPSSPAALQGCVEFFSSTVLPIVPFEKSNEVGW